VDELSLYRRVGSVGVMAEQMAHLLDVAALPHRPVPGRAARRASGYPERVHRRRRRRVRGTRQRRVRLHRAARFTVPAASR
jgi:hypothetical protein